MRPDLNARELFWHEANHFPIDVDLKLLLNHLGTEGYQCRVTELDRQQVLWVLAPSHWSFIAEFVDQVNHLDIGNLPQIDPPENSPRNRRYGLKLLLAFTRTPFVFVTIALGVLGGLLTEFDHNFHWVGLLTFQPVEASWNQLAFHSPFDAVIGGEWWRPVTPIFLHFGALHVVFNCLWVWEFGRRLEGVLGSFSYLALLLFIGAVGNLAQFGVSGPSLFGGLSGVLYGFLGCLWVYHRLTGDPRFFLRPGLVILLMIWLLLGCFGAVDYFIEGSVANGAHVGGLLAGLFCGWLLAAFSPKHGAKPVVD